MAFPPEFGLLMPKVSYTMNCSTFPENSTHWCNSSMPVLPEQPAYITWLATLFYVIIFLFGLGGNFLVILVILRNKDMRNSTNYFLVNLSVADMLVILVCEPTACYEVFVNEIWHLGSFMCSLVPFLENSVCHASVLTILAISFERFYAICRPLKAQYMCTLGRAIKIVVAIWVFSLGTAAPFFIIAKHDMANYIDGTKVPVCFTPVDDLWEKAYIITITLFFFWIPLLILGILYALICRELAEVDECLHEPGGGSSTRSANLKRQVIIMLIVMISIFFICLLPFRVFSLWGAFADRGDFAQLPYHSYLLLIHSTRILFYLNSAINPILYNLISSKFRLYFRRFRCWGRNQRLRNSPTLTMELTGQFPMRPSIDIRDNWTSRPSMATARCENGDWLLLPTAN